MKIIKDEVVYEGTHLNSVKRHFINKKGKESTWDMVRRKTFGPSVFVVAFTKDNEVLLERTYRVPVDQYILEFPAGLMDIEGELPEEAIRRELIEETGYSAENFELLLRTPVNPGITDEEHLIFLATGAQYLQEPMLGDSEDIEVVKVPADELRQYLMNSSNTIVDIKVIAVLAYLEDRGLI